MPNIDLCNWHGFRTEVLWTREVNLLLDANLESLKLVYDSRSTEKLRKMSMESAINLFTNETNLKLNQIDAEACYAMSLTTCADLHKHSWLKQFHMDFVEFLEMIGRVADLHFSNSDYETQPLVNKISIVLDELLKLVGCVI